MAGSEISRRAFVRVGAGTGMAGALAACAPAAAPEAPPAAPAPAAPAGKAEWEKKWDDLVVAAKKEGNLAIILPAGAGWRKLMDGFEAAFPGIKVDARQFTATSQSVPVITQERDAGVFTFDIWQGSPTIALPQLRPRNMLQSISTTFIRPDVTEDKNWRDGFDAGWLDSAKSMGYTSMSEGAGFLAVDTNQVQEGEIKTIQDMLNPKWKGKVAMADVRTGSTWGPLMSARLLFGEDVVKRLVVDQQPTFTTLARELAESVVRGKVAFVIGSTPVVMGEFTNQGVGKNVKFVDVEGLTYISLANGAFYHMSRAPHPNAAQVFLNWIFTKEGQTLWAELIKANSRRSDVAPADPLALPKPGRKYIKIGPESSLEESAATQKFLNDLVGIKN